jgi:hypothetical protein
MHYKSNFDSTALKPAGESSGKTISAFGMTPKENKGGAGTGKTFLVVGSMVNGLLLGYYVFLKEAVQAAARRIQPETPRYSNSELRR